jgi:hypothetical protein
MKRAIPGSTNSVDAALVLQLDAGLIPSLPAGEAAARRGLRRSWRTGAW